MLAQKAWIHTCDSAGNRKGFLWHKTEQVAKRDLDVLLSGQPQGKLPCRLGHSHPFSSGRWLTSRTASLRHAASNCDSMYSAKRTNSLPQCSAPAGTPA